MRLPRWQFTLSSLIVWMALVALNLGVGVATSHYFPRRPVKTAYLPNSLDVIHSERRSPRDFVSYVDGGELVTEYRWYYSDRWLRRDGVGLPPGYDYKLVCVGREPIPPSLLQIWAPVLGSVSISLLVLFVPLRLRLLQDPGDSIVGHARFSGRSSRFRFAVRWSMAIAAMISLNLAGAVYRPPDDDERHQLRIHELVYGHLQGPQYLRPDEHRGGHFSMRHSLSEFAYHYQDLSFGTMVTRVDGGVVAYQGIPGSMTGEPRWLRDPSRPFWEMHWAKFASTAITLLVIFTIYRQYGSARKLADPDSAI